MSSPCRSISGAIRRPISPLTIAPIIALPTTATTIVTPIAFNCSSQRVCPTIFARPFCVAALRGAAMLELRFGFTLAVANTPVRNAPSVPPTAWMPKVSSASSYPSQDFNFVQAKNGTIPAATPIITAPVGATYPQAGVITTSPATAPEQNPSTLGLPRSEYSSMAQVNEATAVASVVVMNAFAAIPSAARALPALNPYQPTQSKPVPTMHSTILCGAMISFLNPSLCPRRMHSTSADQPEVI